MKQSRLSKGAMECELVQFTKHNFHISIDIVMSIAIHLHTIRDVANLVNSSSGFRQDKDSIYCQWLKYHLTPASFVSCFERCNPRAMERALLHLNETDRVVLLTDMLEMCVSKGDNVTPISWAIKNGGRISDKVFIYAVMRGRCDVVEYFISQGTDVNTMDGLALFMGVYFQNDRMATILCKSGAYSKFTNKVIWSLTSEEVRAYYLASIAISDQRHNTPSHQV